MLVDANMNLMSLYDVPVWCCCPSSYQKDHVSMSQAPDSFAFRASFKRSSCPARLGNASQAKEMTPWILPNAINETHQRWWSAIEVLSHCAFATWALHPPGASNLAKALAKLAMSWQRFQQKNAKGTNIGEKHVGCPFCPRSKHVPSRNRANRVCVMTLEISTISQHFTRYKMYVFW